MSIRGSLVRQSSKEIRICQLPFDIISGRKILRIAANVDIVHVLIDANVIDSHSVWESEVFEVDNTKVFRHAQVNDDVLR
jgi:hypothetical protein